MAVKIFFLGNKLAGDDGIGIRMHEELANDKRLKKARLICAGVNTIDIINEVEEGDLVIIVDAVESKKKTGTIEVIEEGRIPKPKVYSAHDIGLEQTVRLIRMQKQGIERIVIIGISIKEAKPYKQGLSEQILKDLSKIKENLITIILQEIRKCTNSA